MSEDKREVLNIKDGKRTVNMFVVSLDVGHARPIPGSGIRDVETDEEYGLLHLLGWKHAGGTLLLSRWDLESDDWEDLEREISTFAFNLARSFAKDIIRYLKRSKTRR